MTWWRAVLGMCCALFVAGQALAADLDIYMVVNGVPIERGEVEMAFLMEARRQFYHGRIDDARMSQLRRDVEQRMADRVLLLQEAQGRGFRVGEEELALRLQQALGQYKLAELADEERRSLVRALESQLADEILLERLKAEVQALGAPSESQLTVFYQNNLDKFTTPERLHLSVILLKVPPSASWQAWEAAQLEGERLRQKVLQGADFAGLAKIHSSDDSAARGGDLGYVHHGMLSEEAQAAVDALQPGELSPVVMLLQGVALFRLEGRRVAEINPMSKVLVRLEGLWQREEEQLRWEALLSHLRAGAEIVVNDKITP